MFEPINAAKRNSNAGIANNVINRPLIASRKLRLVVRLRLIIPVKQGATPIQSALNPNTVTTISTVYPTLDLDHPSSTRRVAITKRTGLAADTTEAHLAYGPRPRGLWFGVV